MMFYTQLFTSKRGSLAKIWLAAHWERKITKAHVFECNLESTIKDIMSPQIKIGLRTSGHLLLGVVRIYFRKAKYLLADCNDAVVKIKVAFRPGQTDMPVEGLEATRKAITLIEDFTDFDTQLPDANAIGVVDHFSLNQCRTEDITLKEDFGNSFLTLEDFGDETQSYQGGLLDMSFQSLAQQGDAFGDEDAENNLLDFIASCDEPAALTDFFPDEPHVFPDQPRVFPVIIPIDVNQEDHPDTPTTSVADKDDPPVLNQMTLLVNEDEGFALEPVAVTPTSERKKGKRRRRLLVDQAKELSNQTIRTQLADYSDLTAPMDVAPPTRQLMQWKESGGVEYLFSHLCSPVMHPHLQQLYSRNLFQGKTDWLGNTDDNEEMRGERHEVEADVSVLPSELSALHETGDPDRTGHSMELTPQDHVNNSQSDHALDSVNDVSRAEDSQPELPSEESVRVHPYVVERETTSTVTRNTQSMVGSQDDFEERRMTNQAQKLLKTLKVQLSCSNIAVFSLHTLCQGRSRSQTATTFFSLLVLKKQQALDLQQSEPYADIKATPGPRFYEM